METAEILSKIQKLPTSQKMHVVEETMSLLRREERDAMKKAADALLYDYESNKELTIFTNLDFERFYETK